MVTVDITSEALEQLDGLPAEIVARVERLLERLEKWPQISGAKALSGPLAGHWRLRTGDYRLQFRVEQQTVIVEKIGHRAKFYEG
jgi:mRNA-degrading endonuclease RelE of RelBE toxin-antitoxin system